MRTTIQALCTALAITAATIATGQNAHATLGEQAESVETDRHAMSAQQAATTTTNNYTVKEMKSPSTSVREYISPSGVVFAIAWDGIMYPNISQLLGSYDTDYRDTLKKTPRTRGQRRQQIDAATVVVQKWGHMRDLRGRAYAPALIPQGVKINEIK